MTAPSPATVAAREALDRAAAKRPYVSEATLDRLRVRWELCELVDAGVVRSFHSSAGRTIIDARGWKGERAYRSTRELEAFVHGAQAGQPS